MKKFLIIQTAFIGDVILATSVVETLKKNNNQIVIDFLLRKGNESLLANNPLVRKIHIWNKQHQKYRNLFKVIQECKKEKYDYVINLQRFTSTALISVLLKPAYISGFRSSLLSMFYNFAIKHDTENALHEIERNYKLIEPLISETLQMPKLYPSDSDYKETEKLINKPFITISPTSVWYTKQYPKEKWLEFISEIPDNYTVYLLGGKADETACSDILKLSGKQKIFNLAGKLTFLQSSALMKNAVLNYVNDSGPLHLASAMNATVAAIFCSTVPEFGFGPLSDKKFIIQTKENLDCRPCGIHGHKECPMKHFKCGYQINTDELLLALKNA